jgi:cytochrome P450 family 2 subfamily D
MVFQGQKSFMAILDNLLTENRTTWDPDQPPRNLTDAFLAEIEKVNGSSKRCSQGLWIEIYDL